ncbi:MAG: dTDP-4-dehydrorhamnose 3,5-epimerase [Crocinitomicaceae bacterium]
MKLIKTHIEDLVALEPKVYSDDRGYFFEPFNQKWFNENVGKTVFVQDNESQSSRGVLRGLHFQKPPMAQAKLVRVIKGEVLDVAVDLRLESPTYGESFSILLNETNKKQLFVPRGFAHGFAVLSETAIFAYKVDNDYSPENEGGIQWNDATLSIDWKLKDDDVLLSGKDKELGCFKDFASPFINEYISNR